MLVESDAPLLVLLLREGVRGHVQKHLVCMFSISLCNDAPLESLSQTISRIKYVLSRPLSGLRLSWAGSISAV